jgi:DNA repair protein RecO
VLYKTEGIIIKKANLGEFDRLITIYSKDFGKIIVKAKAVRKNQAKLRGHLELFLRSHLMIAPGRGWDIVTGAETIESFPYLHQHLSSLAAAYYLAELIDQLIVGPEKDENIWLLLLSSFQQLNQTLASKPSPEQENQNIRKIIRDFEVNLLNFLGYGSADKDPTSFLHSLLEKELSSKYFLQKTVPLLK